MTIFEPSPINIRKERVISVDDQTKTKCISLCLCILEAHIGMSCIELSAFNHESKQSPKKL